MNARVAPMIGALVCLSLVRAGPCSALSLKTSVAETFLGDVLPGSTLVYSKAKGAKLRVINSGRDPTDVELQVAVPSVERCRDGFEPWPFPDSVRLIRGASAGVLSADASEEFDMAVAVPKSMPADGGLYEVNIVVKGRDPSGAILPMRIRALLSVGRPPLGPPEDALSLPGFGVSLSNPAPELIPWDGRGHDPGGATTLKVINASEKDVVVTLSPAREWDENVRFAPGTTPVPNPKWLHFETEEIAVRTGAIGQVKVWASIPKQARYVGRRFGFVAAADAWVDGRRSRRYFVVYVELGRPEGSTRVR